MAPLNNNDVHMAVQQINNVTACLYLTTTTPGLTQLRHEHAGTKDTVSALLDQVLIQQRHMNQIDRLIDEHQHSIDLLMKLIDTKESDPLENQLTATFSTFERSTEQPPSALIPVSSRSRDHSETRNHQGELFAEPDSDKHFDRKARTCEESLPQKVIKLEDCSFDDQPLPAFNVHSVSALDQDQDHTDAQPGSNQDLDNQLTGGESSTSNRRLITKYKNKRVRHYGEQINVKKPSRQFAIKKHAKVRSFVSKAPKASASDFVCKRQPACLGLVSSNERQKLHSLNVKQKREHAALHVEIHAKINDAVPKITYFDPNGHKICKQCFCSLYQFSKFVLLGILKVVGGTVKTLTEKGEYKYSKPGRPTLDPERRQEAESFIRSQTEPDPNCLAAPVHRQFWSRNDSVSSIYERYSSQNKQPISMSTFASMFKSIVIKNGSQSNVCCTICKKMTETLKD